MEQAVITVHGVPSGQARAEWSVVGQWVTDALERGQSLLDARQVLEWIERQEAQLWMVRDARGPCAAFVTQIESAPKGSALSVVALGGSGLDEWIPGVEDTIVEFARDKGCKRVQLSGRRGWVRQLAGFGWGEASVNMTKEL